MTHCHCRKIKLKSAFQNFAIHKLVVDRGRELGQPGLVANGHRSHERAAGSHDLVIDNDFRPLPSLVERARRVNEDQLLVLESAIALSPARPLKRVIPEGNVVGKAGRKSTSDVPHFPAKQQERNDGLFDFEFILLSGCVDQRDSMDRHDGGELVPDVEGFLQFSLGDKTGLGPIGGTAALHPLVVHIQQTQVVPHVIIEELVLDLVRLLHVPSLAVEHVLQ